RGVDLEGLVQWGAAPPLAPGRWTRVIAWVVPAWALTALVAWLWLETTPSPFLAALIVEIVFTVWWSRRAHHVLAPIGRRALGLAFFAGVLACLDREPFDAPRLRELQAGLFHDGLSPSQHIARLSRLIHMLNSWRNQFFAPVAFLLLWTTHLTLALE